MQKIFKSLWISLGILLLQVKTNGADEYAASWMAAKQSSQLDVLVPEFAVDGDRDTCSQSQSQSDPWWRLELRNEYRVSTVTVTNANDANYYRINGCVIRVGNSSDVYSNPICAVIPTIPAGATVNFSCGGIVGRYVILHIPGDQKCLVLCEVNVYGNNIENAALWRTASQVSTYFELSTNQYEVASFAVDGQREPCSHTKPGSDSPWWRVDLLNEYYVDRVAVTNRNGFSWRINGSVIRVGNFPDVYSNTICDVISTIPADCTDTFSCGGMVGRYVVIHNPGIKRLLTLSEVEVYGDLIGNLASNGSATQSSTFSDWSAERAIDGDRGLQQIGTGCSSTLSETNPWWRLDLSGIYAVDRVVVTNRNDCCAEQINGAEIHIGNSLENNGNDNPICAVIPAIPAGQSVSYSCDGMEGRYVSLIVPGDMKSLTLCELEVFEGPVFKRSILRLKFNSSSDLTDLTVRENVLEQLGSALEDRGLTNLTLSWSQTPKPESQTQTEVEPDTNCIKIP